MKILIVGGSGLIGGEAALHLAKNGHDITIMARKKPTTPCLAAFNFLSADYIYSDLATLGLSNYDALVFSAAADIRNIPIDGSMSPAEFYNQANDEAVPAFFAAAKAAGIERAVYIGTFYPQVAPHQIGPCPYVTSRAVTDRKVRALADESFSVCSLNAPFVLGHIEGLLIPHLKVLVDYASGKLTELPIFAPPGGTNHMSSKSIAQAVENALQRGQTGKAYLIGDENYSWQEYLQLWFEAAGNKTPLPVKNDDHPILPNMIMFAGVGETVSYDMDEDDMQCLGYERNQIKPLIEEVIAAYRD